MADGDEIRENRRLYYLEKARQAEAAAADAPSDAARESFLTIASRWRELAEEVSGN